VHVCDVRYFRSSFQTSLAVRYVIIEFDNLDKYQKEDFRRNA
jgi:hypothetical protein